MQTGFGREMAVMKVMTFTGTRPHTIMIFCALKPNITLASPISYCANTVCTMGDMLQNKTFNMDYTFQALYLLHYMNILIYEN